MTTAPLYAAPSRPRTEGRFGFETGSPAVLGLVCAFAVSVARRTVGHPQRGR